MTHIVSKIKATTFLTDGGLETDLIFNKGIDLPHFAAFPLVENPKHSTVLNNYYREYMDIAKEHKTGFILESPTWRANPDWGFKLGYTENDLRKVNLKAIKQLVKLKNDYNDDIIDIFISGQLGPRGDGYQVETIMTIDEAEKYHRLQIDTFKKANVDLVSAITMTYTEEAIGIALAAKKNELSVVISFTVGTDGNLPSGETLKDAISLVDEATNNYPLYYMINCAHPSHFFDTLKDVKDWKYRIKGIRANASCKSHDELDEATELDTGDIVDLSQWHSRLKAHLPELAVYGGCCGTNASHVASICNHVIN